MEESMARPRKTAGTVYRRKNTAFWWVRYPDRAGRIQRESTGSTDKEEAERFLRARLDARDEGRLTSVLKGKTLTFNEWADWFLERRSKPPFRSENTHAQNLNALKHLRPVFGDVLLADIAPESIEEYLRNRLNADKYVRTRLGIRRIGKLKPYTVHQELRVLTRILNLAVQQKRLAVNPCASVEFPAPINKSFRKPHYMTSSEQARIEMVAPCYLKNLVVMMTEMGFRPYKELLPMKKSQVDLENSVVSLHDSKTLSGIGDLPMTELAREAFKAQMEAARGSEYLFPTPSNKAKNIHHIVTEDLGKDVASGRRTLFPDLPSSAYVRHASKCWRSSRSFCYANAPSA
jgi:hypothetical protein